MSSKQVKRGAWICLLLLFLLIINLPISVTKVSSSNQTFYFKEKEYSISWIHSVEKEEWEEFYQRGKKDLILTHTKFKTFGAGVPSQGKIVAKEKGYVVYQIDRHMSEINLIVSERVKSTLTIGKKEIPLYKRVKDYEEITIKQTKRPYWLLWIS